MKNEMSPPVPLAELATPHQQPGALPDGITVSVALIAETPWRQLRDATNGTFDDYDDASRRVGSGNASSNAERHYRNMTTIVGDGHQNISKLYTRLLNERASALDGEGLFRNADHLFELQRQAAAFAEKDPQKDEGVIAAKERLEKAVAEQAEQQLRMDALAPVRELALEIAADIPRLSRRGRFASIAAGLVLGGLVALGISHVIEDHRAAVLNEIVTSPEMSLAEQSNLRYTADILETGESFVAAAGFGASALAGAGFAAAGKGFFARRRASSIVKKANKSKE